MCGRPPGTGAASLGGACRSVNGMEYTHLGRSGVAVSRLCLGTMNFGAITSEADAQPIMDAAHEHGVNFFDTSKKDA